MGESERLLSVFERLPELSRGELIDFAEFLARKADPVAWALDNAPIDDEPTTPEDLEAIRAALAEPGVITHEQLKRDLGL